MDNFNYFVIILLGMILLYFVGSCILYTKYYDYKIMIKKYRKANLHTLHLADDLPMVLVNNYHTRLNNEIYAGYKKTRKI